jgi:membrane associated rhomboid family serine protease
MTTWVRRLIAANVAVFLLTLLVRGLADHLSLTPARLPRRPWTIVTYMFLHDTPLHITLNMLGVWLFGSLLERRTGRATVLTLYFVGGLAGGLLSLLAPRTTIEGASGAVFGLVVAAALVAPKEWFGLGIFPHPSPTGSPEPRVAIPISWLAAIMALLAFCFALVNGLGGAWSALVHPADWRNFSFENANGYRGGMAQLAHLGGMLGVGIWMKLSRKGISARPTTSPTDP